MNIAFGRDIVETHDAIIVSIVRAPEFGDVYRHYWSQEHLSACKSLQQALWMAIRCVAQYGAASFVVRTHTMEVIDHESDDVALDVKMSFRHLCLPFF